MEPNHELPPVQKTGESNTGKEQEIAPISAESSTGETVSANIAVSSKPSQQVADQSVVSDMPQNGQPTTPTAMSDDQMIADDADLIEKEWVNKAKNIVEKTKNDPHLQNNEMSKMKAQYLKTRYNKDLKVSGE